MYILFFYICTYVEGNATLGYIINNDGYLSILGIICTDIMGILLYHSYDTSMRAIN